MADYDSILKEEKKYEEPIVKKDEEPESFPWFKTNFILISLALIISYIAYYYLILTPDKIFLNDIYFLKEKYLTLLEPLITYDKDNNYNLKGNITLNDNSYNLLINKNEIFNLNLEQNQKALDYYSKDNKNYLKLSNYSDKYYQIYNLDYYNTIKNIKKYLQSDIPKEKFIKKVYVNNAIPIVESNLILNNDDIIKAIGTTPNNNYQVLCTFKNNAITNKVLSMKIIINDLTTEKRMVLQYKNNYLTYKDSKNNIKIELTGNKDEFNMKIHKDDTIYGIIRGLKENNKYQYLYQSIEQVYTISLNITSLDNITTYNLLSSIEKNEITEEKRLDITLENISLDDTTATDITDVEALDYKILTKEEQEKFKNCLNDLIGKLRDFIKEYQD